MSKTRPGVPGYAHARESRVCGVDAINRWLSPMFWSLKTEMGEHRHILLEPQRLSDDWRKVPLLQEWTLDGICLSNEERDLYRGSQSFQRDGQLWNIGIQGPCAVNNGYVNEAKSGNGLAMLQNGQPSRHSNLFMPGYTDDRVERFGPLSVKVDKTWTFAANYSGGQYHTYPLQMFSRDVRPMAELYVGLVATEYTLTKPHVDLMLSLAQAEDNLNQAVRGRFSADSIASYRDAVAQLKKDREFEAAFTALSAYREMGWIDPKTGTPTAEAPKSFAAFRYVFFTSHQAWQFAEEGEAEKAEGEPSAKKQKRTEWFDESQRNSDFKHMVGAWHLGKVLDMKAAKMPHFAGGPAETGYRLTVNVCQEWRDWRALRREYTPVGSAVQIGSEHEPRWKSGVSRVEQTTFFQWPTAFDAKEPDLNTPISIDGIDNTDENSSKPAEQIENYKVAAQTVQTPAAAAAAALAARIAAAGSVPRVEGNPLHTAKLGIARLNAILGGGSVDESFESLERVVAPPPPKPAPKPKPAVAAAAAAAAAAAVAVTPSAPEPLAPLRRRAGHTPEPSPDRSGAVSAEPPSPTPAALSTVIEAPAAPAAGKKRRGSSSDVFASIFGAGSETGPEPLNPQHRADAPTSGRSYQRRGKGKE
ncbi:MAG: hypothetical protein QGF29_12125 [Verrucomicrobiota bacterium]|nr:hypothetical protein [Verrucomicrobiota bacterium]